MRVTNKEKDEMSASWIKLHASVRHSRAQFSTSQTAYNNRLTSKVRFGKADIK